MRVLVLGSGGREHALVWKLSQSPSITNLYALPGNPGIEEQAECLPGDLMDFEFIAEVCASRSIDIVVPGPERPLIAGIADFLRKRGISVFGPSAASARVEGSKAYAKRLMAEAEIPTSEFGVFKEYHAASNYARTGYERGNQLVIKADGEALGKGVLVCDTLAEAQSALKRMLVDREFGAAGAEVVIERRLRGRELSLVAICAGRDYALLPTAVDYKRAYSGDTGPNTGGMGAVSPAPFVSDDESRALAERFIEPMLAILDRKGTPYVGALFAGLMQDAGEWKALEYNCRFGDPETQATMLRIHSDLAVHLKNAVDGSPIEPLETTSGACCVVVVASKGYPGSYANGVPVPPLIPPASQTLFHAGTIRTAAGIVSSGGRVLNLCACEGNVADAAASVYGTLRRFVGDEWHYRTDIGHFPEPARTN